MRTAQKRCGPDALMTDKPEQFVAHYSIAKLLYWILASGAMTATSIAFAMGLFRASGLFALTVGGFGTLFFGLVTVVFAIRCFDRQPQVLINSKGLTLRPHGIKPIKLRSIERMHIDFGRLSLFVFKPSKYPIERWHRKLIYRINGDGARAFFGDAWIWSSYLDCSLEELVSAIDEHRPKTEHEKKVAEIVASWDAPPRA